MTELLIGAAFIAVCVILEGFFSGTETAMVSIDQNRIKAEAARGSKQAGLIIETFKNPEKFFSTTLLGTNMVVVLSNAVATFLVIENLGERYEYLTILIMSPLILVFGEIVPKTIYRYHAEQIVPHLIYPLRAITALLYPFITLLSWIAQWCVKPFGMESPQLRPHTTREDLENYLDMWDSGRGLKSAEKKMIERIFDFVETDVEDIMIRLINTEALEVQETLDTAIALASKTGFSRIPVYAEDAYNIVGIVHAFDLLAASDTTKPLKNIMRPARYVPNTAPVDTLLKQMRTEGNSIAVVVNEYGGTTGIITIEDILEEVVGEIYDEYDKQENFFVKIGRDKYLVKAHIEIDELNERLNLKLPKDDYETLAGFLLKYMKRIPRTGESFTLEDIRFRIKQADKRSVQKVIISVAADKEEPAKTT